METKETDKIVRQKLQGYPQIVYNTQQGWEKMQQKMHVKKVKKLFAWKSIAAAILLLAAGFLSGKYYNIKSNSHNGKQTAKIIEQTATPVSPYISKQPPENIPLPAKNSRKRSAGQTTKPNTIVQVRKSTIAGTLHQKRMDTVIINMAGTSENQLAKSKLPQKIMPDETMMNKELTLHKTAIKTPAPLPVMSINEIADIHNPAVIPQKQKPNIFTRLAAYQQKSNMVASAHPDPFKINL